MELLTKYVLNSFPRYCYIVIQKSLSSKIYERVGFPVLYQSLSFMLI